MTFAYPPSKGAFVGLPALPGAARMTPRPGPGPAGGGVSGDSVSRTGRMPSGAAIVGVPGAGRRVGGLARGHGAARPEGPAGSHAVAALVAKPGLITRVAELARVAARAGLARA